MNELSYSFIDNKCKRLAIALNVEEPKKELVNHIFQSMKHIKEDMFSEICLILSKKEYYKFPGNGAFCTTLKVLHLNNGKKIKFPKIPDSEIPTEQDWQKIHETINKKSRKCNKLNILQKEKLTKSNNVEKKEYYDVWGDDN